MFSSFFMSSVGLSEMRERGEKGDTRGVKTETLYFQLGLACVASVSRTRAETFAMQAKLGLTTVLRTFPKLCKETMNN